MRDNSAKIDYLREHVSENKAKGLIAETDLHSWIEKHCGSPKASRLYSGCWLLSPNVAESYKARAAFFIHPICLETDDKAEEAVKTIEEDARFQSIAYSFSQSGFGVFLAVPQSQLIGDSPRWNLFRFKDERLVRISSGDVFARWQAGRGRASVNRKGWTPELEARMARVPSKVLAEIYNFETFYSEYIKAELKIPVADPYDIDAFLVSNQGTVLPVEIKEKSPYGTKKQQLLGIDAGRILMLLRFCLPQDSNGLYIVREIEEEEPRTFKRYTAISLDKIVMCCSLNLQSGGVGMLGGNTQAVMLPYSEFTEITCNTFTNEEINAIGKLSSAAKRCAREFTGVLESYLRR